jgi:hypothetical protein
VVGAAEVELTATALNGTPFSRPSETASCRRVDVDGAGDHGVATFPADAEAPPIDFETLCLKYPCRMAMTSAFRTRRALPAE